MTELALAASRRLIETANYRTNPNAWRLLLLVAIAALLSVSPGLREVTLGALADAYLQVTVFVAGTLAIVVLAETRLGFDMGEVFRRHRRWQPLIAAALGASPGCGGAIVVVTQYVRGQATFGSFVGVLIATMGDAAFLMLAREPMTGLMLIGLGFACGAFFGYLVDLVHGTDFMRHKADPAEGSDDEAAVPSRRLAVADLVWLAMLAPGIVFGLLGAFQIDPDAALFGEGGIRPVFWFGVTGALLSVAMWAFSRRGSSHGLGRNAGDANAAESVVLDTNFVTAWVVVGFLSYEIVTHFAGAGVEHWLDVWRPFTPLMAILIGFLPGCGPQIVTVTVYLSGAIPLSAVMGNAIANDGDALFPAIALAPRAALLATIYSGLPAFIVAYGYYFLFE
ncbi:MAG: putative manganese transporter [Flavobacteriaceae bacterium]